MKLIKLSLIKFLRGVKMKLVYKKSAYLFFFFYFFLVSSFLFPQSLEELLKQGDAYLDSEFNLTKAMDAYQKADALSPNNWEVDWRLSRTYVYSAEQMPDKTSEQKDAQLAEYQKAYDLADKAVKFAPDKSITYLRRGIANGKIALFKGVFSVASVVNAVRDDCEKAVSLGNGGNYTQALAHYVLARTNAKVSEKWAPARAILGLGWADIDKAIDEYNIAIKLYPNYRMFYLDLAKAYIREDEYDKAKEMLKKTIESPKREFNDDSALTEARDLQNQIKDE
jgi:tetratricopeptide (TPR) repeat protein